MRAVPQHVGRASVRERGGHVAVRVELEEKGLKVEQLLRLFGFVHLRRGHSFDERIPLPTSLREINTAPAERPNHVVGDGRILRILVHRGAQLGRGSRLLRLVLLVVILLATVLWLLATINRNV